MPSTQTQMKPMFLPGVERNPQPGPYAEMIRKAQESGGEYWKIWHLFAFRPAATAHLARFTHAVMHEDAPLTPALRELIAAYTSSVNQCEFCTKCHAAIAAELMGSEELVWNALRDLESSALPEKDKALLRFAGKVTRELPAIAEADAQALRGIGWTDDEIFYTITVCSLFNFYNRWVTASGVPAVSHEGHLSRAAVVARHGYIRE
ncbi:MAG: peroxidase-related enzyme [Candidatus Acidiferrales bacterium]